MELPEAAGLRCCEREACGFDAVLPEDRQLAIDDAKARILFQQLVDVRVARFAVGAGVVVEFDEGDLGLLRAFPGRAERRFQAARAAASVGAFCLSRSASAASTRIWGSASIPCRTMRLLRNCGAAKQQHGGGQHRPIIPPITAAPSDELLLTVSVTSLYFLSFLQLGLGDHGDVLSTKIVGSSSRNPAHCHFGTGQCEFRIAFEIAALRGRKRRARRIALLVVDDPQLVPGERVLIVAADRCLQDRLRLGVILPVFSVAISAWPSMEAISGALWTVATASRSGAMASAGLPPSSRIWPFSSRK